MDFSEQELLDWYSGKLLNGWYLNDATLVYYSKNQPIFSKNVDVNNLRDSVRSVMNEMRNSFMYKGK